MLYLVIYDLILVLANYAELILVLANYAELILVLANYAELIFVLANYAELILVLANYAELVIYDWAPVTRNRKRQLKIMADADTEPLTTEVSKIGHCTKGLIKT